MRYYFARISLNPHAGHLRSTRVSVREATSIGVPQHAQLGIKTPPVSYLVATASISTRMSSRANPVTIVARAGLCFPKNLA